MSKIAILAEKPSQAKAYSDAYSVKSRTKTHIELNPCSTFPDGAIITWGIGHLVELKEPKEYSQKWASWKLSELPIMPDKYQYKVVKGKYSHFTYIKSLFKDPSIMTIINACDIDREGSNIFYSIYYMTGAKNKTIKRLWINSLEIDEVRKGFNNLEDNKRDLLLYEEAKARQISDWLVGMNGSRLYTLLLQKKGFMESISIGRVQSPTVYLIYKRQTEIENFVPKPFYEIEGKFSAQNGKYVGKVKVKSDKVEEIQSIMANHEIKRNNVGIVKDIVKTEKRTKSPKLHALSTLQATANRAWKYSPDKVLKITQGLYEKKLVTYPRTDTQFITDNEFAYLLDNVKSYQEIANNKFEIRSQMPNKRYVDGLKVKEHHAIVPTKKIPSEKVLQALSKEEKNLYFEILKTTLAMFHYDYIYEETKIKTDVNGLAFDTVGKTEISKGWRELFSIEDKNFNEKEDSQTLPLLIIGESVESTIRLKESMTTPPKPYTEGQLIGMMKTCGKAIEDEEELAILKEIEGLGTEATRSGIIETIKRHNYIEVKKNIVSLTKKGEILCQAIEGNLLSSPSMTAKWEAYLKKIGNGEGSREYFLDKISKFIDKLILEVPNQLHREDLDNNLKSAQEGNLIVLCPTCKTGSIQLKKTFYTCTAYETGCKQRFPASLLGKKLTETHIKDLCTKGRTKLIKGMKSKKGKFFSAILILEEGNIKFEFLSNRK